MQKKTANLEANENLDLTEFWLAWKKTCAIRLCLTESSLGIHNAECRRQANGKSDSELIDSASFPDIVNQTQTVVRITNRSFSKLIRYPHSVAALNRFKREHERCDGGMKKQMDVLDKEIAEQERAWTEMVQDDSHGNARRDVWQDGSNVCIGNTEGRDDAGDAEISVAAGKACRVDVGAKSKGELVSEYRDLIASWARCDENVVNAFELMELYMYRKCTHKEDGEPQLDGQKLKDFLFEVRSKLPGGMCKNLWGYLLKEKANGPHRSMLWQAADASYNVTRDPSVRDGEEPERPVDDVPLSSPTSKIIEHEIETTVKDYWAKRWRTEYDAVDRVALFCTAFNVPMDAPEIVAITHVGRSSFYKRREKQFRDLLLYLKGKGYLFDDVQVFMSVGMRNVLEAVVKIADDGASRNLMKIIESIKREKQRN